MILYDTTKKFIPIFSKFQYKLRKLIHWMLILEECQQEEIYTFKMIKSSQTCQSMKKTKLIISKSPLKNLSNADYQLWNNKIECKLLMWGTG